MANGGTVNTELAQVLRRHQQHKKKTAKRWISIRLKLVAEYHDTEDEARAALDALWAGLRAAIVDRETGQTWVSRSMYQRLMNWLRKEEGTAPERFQRQGPLGRLSTRLRRKGD